MIDSNLLSAEPRARAADTDWTQLRNQVRDMIRAEVDRFNPTDEARRPLELIVESFVRYANKDGRPVITVIDASGQPRTKTEHGQALDFTIGDLLEEQRRTRPMLFKGLHDHGEKAQPPVAAVKEPPRRDWLKIDSGPMAPGEEAPDGAPQEQRIRRLRRGKTRLHVLNRKAFKRWVRPAAALGSAKLQAVRNELPHRFDQARSLMDRSWTPSLHGGRGLVLGAVAALGFLIVGGFVLSTRDSAPDASNDGPATTGTVSAQAPEPERPRTPTRATLRGVPDVIDTATLSLQGEVVRLFGVEWAPGAGKPDDLTQYLSGREVVCEPAGQSDAYRCQVAGGADLSKVVLFNGGGKATADASPDLKDAADKARDAQLGVWSKSQP
jgi:endonuclease YncB( thermonuclease family)